MKPTTEYFTKGEHDNIFITPEMNNSSIEVSQLPMRIWTCQLNSPQYPTRPFYMLDFNKEKIKETFKSKLNLNDDDMKSINDATNGELERLRKLSPFTFSIVRESYLEDKESLIIESVEGRNHEDLPIAYFSLQVQSMSESENYWLDSGEFANLSINIK